ncbi:hypothetical protein [Mycolicibacterium sp. CR10]|uniref:hypothetical protein n=1 Tax=Mycolicibacterium sp. CR10 TaxID=2562314 RepID=UPI0010C07F33|nr:hypothetical protein [Mycolicibacterium sp. CR10]
MNHTDRTRVVTGALLAGGIALAGFGFGAAPAQAGPISGSMGDGSVRPVSPASRAGFDPQPEPPALAGDGSVRPQSPGVRVGFNPQPEPPV